MKNLPLSFAERMQLQLGEAFPAFETAMTLTPPVSIRANMAKLEQPLGLPHVPWSSQGYYLPERPLFTLDPLLHAGAYYVQEASSMFLEQALKQAVDVTEPLRVLDLCGAPGGKSTHLASLLSAESLLVSNEVIRSRATILAENIAKWGSGNVVVTNNDPRDFQKLPEFFDVMVVDAPCSGEGMFRKDPQAMEEWSEENVKLCAQRQQRILMDVWPALKPGGVLIYSTCTWNTAENEDNIAWLAQQEGAKSLALELEASWGIVPGEQQGVQGYRFYPHQLQGEGFFLAVIQKSGEGAVNGTSGKRKKYKLALAGKKEKALVESWLKNTEELEWLQYGDYISAIPANLFEEVDTLYQNLYVLQAGTEVAEAKGKKLKPQHQLALSQQLSLNEFDTAEVSLEQALRYLRKEDIQLGGSGSNWVLLQYQGYTLGWAKQIGNRMNNYYPKEWRIRMELPAVVEEEQLFSLTRYLERF
ncbi:rRNA methyltransferase [Pontibacter qinzhouensis]|uniref:rRNA methyltransferase n=1 Tax=Pontibacter qinzhouensis TaxID=2603253 RepID=A0A5C8JFT5_9BACT|nr:rRNA methyltransferase [Pontibacter qinzhouensis]TXK36599.1 rRNA methyltransferase [Pontibacter qinzhouensis]